MIDKNITFKTGKSFEDVVRDGLSQIDSGEGFEYTVGEIYGSKLKVVFELEKSHDSVVIDGVNGFGYTLAVEINKHSL